MVVDWPPAVRALRPTADDEPRSEGVGRRLQQHHEADVCIVEECDPDGADDRQRQQAGGKRQERPAKSCPTKSGDARHSIAPWFARAKARRSRRSERSIKD